MKINLSKFFQARAHVLLFRHMPASVSYVYMQAIGRLYYLVNRKEKRLIEKNIRDMLSGGNERHIRGIIRQTFKGIFSHYYEKMYSAYKDIDTIRRFVGKKITIQNEQAISEAMSLGKGVILVTAHWGAVEFIPWVLSLREYPVSIILECQTKHLEKALSERAELMNGELLSNSADASVFFSALASLKRNRLLMTECDEVDAWRKRPNMTIELFGKKLNGHFWPFAPCIDLITFGH